MNLFVFLIVYVLICVTAALSRFLAIKKEEKYKNGFGRKLNVFLLVVTLIICVPLIVIWLINFLENIYISNPVEIWFGYQMRIDLFLLMQVDKVLILYFSLTYFLYSCRSRGATIFHSVFSIFDIFTIFVMVFKTNGSLLFFGVSIILAVMAFFVLPPVVIFQTVQNFVAVLRKPKVESDQNELQLQTKPQSKGVFASVLLVFVCVVIAMTAFLVNVVASIGKPILTKIRSFDSEDKESEIIILEKTVYSSGIHNPQTIFYIYLKDGLFSKEAVGDIELELYPNEYEVVWEEDNAIVRFIGKNKTNQPELLGEYTVILNGGKENG